MGWPVRTLRLEFCEELHKEQQVSCLLPATVLSSVVPVCPYGFPFHSPSTILSLLWIGRGETNGKDISQQLCFRVHWPAFWTGVWNSQHNWTQSILLRTQTIVTEISHSAQSGSYMSIGWFRTVGMDRKEWASKGFTLVSKPCPKPLLFLPLRTGGRGPKSVFI